jgi:VanZ family protein
MSQPAERRGGIGPGVRWLVWGAYALTWTTLLVMPMPSTEPWEEFGFDVKYLLGKSLHVAAYALLTALTGWLRPPFRFRLLLLFLVMAHAPVTELIQLHVSNRTGCLEDVGFDHLGAAVGLLLAWRWWSAPE